MTLRHALSKAKPEEVKNTQQAQKKIKKNVNQFLSSSPEGGTSVGCVGAMRCLRGDLVEEIAHHDGLAGTWVIHSGWVGRHRVKRVGR